MHGYNVDRLKNPLRNCKRYSHRIVIQLIDKYQEKEEGLETEFNRHMTVSVKVTWSFFGKQLIIFLIVFQAHKCILSERAHNQSEHCTIWRFILSNKYVLLKVPSPRNFQLNWKFRSFIDTDQNCLRRSNMKDKLNKFKHSSNLLA